MVLFHAIQETQLSLTNRALRLEVSQVTKRFDILGMVSYWCSLVTLSLRKFWNMRLVSIQWLWNPGYWSLKIIGTDTDRSANYDINIPQ